MYFCSGHTRSLPPPLTISISLNPLSVSLFLPLTPPPLTLSLLLPLSPLPLSISCSFCRSATTKWEKLSKGRKGAGAGREEFADDAFSEFSVHAFRKLSIGNQFRDRLGENRQTRYVVIQTRLRSCRHSSSRDSRIFDV